MGTRGEYVYMGEYERYGGYHTTYDADGRRVFSFPLRKKIQFKYDFDFFEY
jgi:hypothetical protein